MEASSMTPMAVQDGPQETTKDTPDEQQLSNRNGGNTDEVIFIRESTVSIIMDRAQSAFHEITCGIGGRIDM